MNTTDAIESQRPYYEGLVGELKKNLQPGVDKSNFTHEDVARMRSQLDEVKKVSQFYRGETSDLFYNLPFYAYELNHIEERIKDKERFEQIDKLVKSDPAIASFVKRVHEGHPNSSIENGVFQVNIEKVILLETAILEFHGNPKEFATHKWIMNVMNKNEIDIYECPSQVVDDFLELQKFTDFLIETKRIS